VLFSALGGAVVDRADRKVIFVITQSAFLLMALFLGAMNYSGTIRVWHLLSVSEYAALSNTLYRTGHRYFLHQAVTQFMPVFARDILAVGAPASACY